MDFNRPSRFWSAVGKLALVVGIAAGAITLWQYFTRRDITVVNPLEPQLVGTIQYSRFDLPPDIVDQFDALRKRRDLDFAEKYVTGEAAAVATKLVTWLSGPINSAINSVHGTNERRFDWVEEGMRKEPAAAVELKSRVAGALAPILSDYAGTGWAAENTYQTPDYDSYLVIAVENTGARQALGVELRLPHSGMSVLDEAGEKPRSTAFDQKVALGTVLPHATKRLRLWTKTPVRDYSFKVERWELTSADGAGKLEVLKKD